VSSDAADTTTVLHVVVESADVIAAEESFRRILQGRSRRLLETMNALPVVGRRNLFRLLQVLTPLVWFLGLFVTGAKIANDEEFWVVLPWGLLTLLFGVLSAVVLLLGGDLADDLLLRLTDRLRKRAARKTVEKTLPPTPFHVTYTFDAAEWVTVVESPPIERRLRRDAVHEVVCDGPVCLVFRSRNAQFFDAVVWAKTPEVRLAIEGFCA